MNKEEREVIPYKVLMWRFYYWVFTDEFKGMSLREVWDLPDYNRKTTSLTPIRKEE